MRALELNLASRPYRNNTLVWLAYIGLLTAAVAFTYWNVSSFRHYGRELAELDRKQGNMEQEQRDLAGRHQKILSGIKRYDRVTIARRTSKANEVIEWKAFSWTQLFNRLEKVLPFNIKMTSVRPVFRNRDRDRDELDTRRSMPVKVDGLARNWDSLFELETALIESESFGRVLPRHIDKMDNGELAFSIEFVYYPDAAVTATAEDVAQAAPESSVMPAAADPGVTVTKPAKADAGRRKLPQAVDEPTEVTDAWMARAKKDEPAAPAAETDTPAATNPQQAKRNTARQPARRTLPKAQPEPADGDDEEGPR